MRGNKQLNKFLQKNRFIYPFIVSFLVSALTFPGGPGMFMVLYSSKVISVRWFSSMVWSMCLMLSENCMSWSIYRRLLLLEMLIF